MTSRDWCSTLKYGISSDNSIPPLGNDDQIITDNLDKPNLLNDNVKEQTIIDKDVDVSDMANELNLITLSPAEIKVVLKSLPVGKAVGPDGFSNKNLLELSIELTLPFCSLFNQSQQTGVFPDCWKVSNVCPIS